MYEALWTNGPKESIEFFDYTYDEHFGGRPLPVYMPRQAMLEYMIGRVTKHCPDFFGKYAKFNTRVTSVKFVEATSKFQIVTKDLLTGKDSTEAYDKCIWAAGMNGHPMIPPQMLDMLREGGFSGRIMHSSDTSNFENDVKGKRILLIGGSYSGEDLALMAVKCGATQIYISSRSKSVTSWTATWPYSKVQVLENQVPVGVTESGRCIQLAAAEGALSDDDIPDDDVPGDEIQSEVRDIDTIIFCTGYTPNLDMLSEDLKHSIRRDEIPEQVALPKSWRMAPNSFTQVLGVVEPADDIKVLGRIYPGLYCGCISTRNPGMMYMAFQTENPLLGIDVSAWLLMRFVTGLRPLPSAQEMLKQEEEAALRALDNPGYRCLMDKNYIEAIEDHWDQLPEMPESKHEWLDEVEADYQETMDIRLLARYMMEAGYPVNVGTVDDLNELGHAYVALDRMTRDHRGQLTEDDAENGKTFRDYIDSTDVVSIFTGSEAVPLKCRWLDIDAKDLTILDP